MHVLLKTSVDHSLAVTLPDRQDRPLPAKPMEYDWMKIVPRHLMLDLRLGILSYFALERRAGVRVLLVFLETR